ncbi:putative ferric-chelate reductase 1 [Megalops cyprinoides]|uniref:putative ferric-chelate reductase 1 n=1 Tax=Megalops cyprinoides TaxID=118141 RepID=UPI001864B733|nr:putative ferric-chelate reductase 1 [Megalops cyprinoides]
MRKMPTHLPDLLLMLAVMAVCFGTVAGFSNGKVTEACKSMVPNHGHHSSTKANTYSITVDKSKFSPGDQIKVTLSASKSGTTYFKGFLIQARDTGRPSADAVGWFTLVNNTASQLLKCGHTQGSAVSHTSDAKKTEVQAIWNSPKNAPSSVQFMVTVVQHYKVYWVKIPGPVVSQAGVTPGPLPSTTTSAETTAPSVLPGPFSAEGCGTRKSCLRDPVGCDPETDPLCSYLSFTPEGQTVLFELSGPADGYVSFALSLDKWMGNDDVYLCVRDEHKVDINAAYVAGRTHPVPAAESALTDMSWRTSDGVIQCRFRRNIHIPQDHNRFSLNESYYLFVANGRAENGMVHRHDRQPLISTFQKVILGPAENLSGSRSPVLIKFHGAFMLVAWMTTVTTGIIVARYFKNDWPRSALFGQKVWFQVHRALMILTVLLTTVGFVLPFVYRGGWSRRAGTHPYFGCIVMALAVIQPLMAVLRPPPDSSRRYIFNWMHLGAGTMAQIIAVFAIFLGIHQQALLLPGPWSTVVLAGFVVWGVVAELVLEFHSRGHFKIGNKDAEDEEEILSNPKDQSNEGTLFKKVVVAVFLCGNIGFLSVLLYTISSV